MSLAEIAAPTPLTWIVHSREGVTALAWPITSEAASDATETAPEQRTRP